MADKPIDQRVKDIIVAAATARPDDEMPMIAHQR